ncbi:MAG: hypothetical protein EOO11_21530 [Chitinophagaceae bacterium]|nr:MAG: hypothetical protein EOO11_21530 [Chitinophagaceae bacterium]
MENELTRPAAKAAFIKALAPLLEARGFRAQEAGRGLHQFVHESAGGARYTLQGSFTRSGDFQPALFVHFPEVTAFLRTLDAIYVDRQDPPVFTSHLSDFLDAANADGYRHNAGPYPAFPLGAACTEAVLEEVAARFATTHLDTALATIMERADSLERAEHLLNVEYPVKLPRYRFSGGQEWEVSVLTPGVPVHLTMGLVLAHLLQRPYVARLRDAAGQYLRRERRSDNPLIELLKLAHAATA